MSVNRQIFETRLLFTENHKKKWCVSPSCNCQKCINAGFQGQLLFIWVSPKKFAKLLWRNWKSWPNYLGRPKQFAKLLWQTKISSPNCYLVYINMKKAAKMNSENFQFQGNCKIQSKTLKAISRKMYAPIGLKICSEARKT